MSAGTIKKRVSEGEGRGRGRGKLEKYRCARKEE
jgi:hypothetical protein